jgi:hypothetical protein
MFFGVAIGAEQFQIAQVIIFVIPVLVMHIQYLFLVVSAPFTSISSQR